jgi:hypothetical protein
MDAMVSGCGVGVGVGVAVEVGVGVAVWVGVGVAVGEAARVGVAVEAGVTISATGNGRGSLLQATVNRASASPTVHHRIISIVFIFQIPVPLTQRPVSTPRQSHRELATLSPLTLDRDRAALGFD